jgi:hypothetical protein
MSQHEEIPQTEDQLEEGYQRWRRVVSWVEGDSAAAQGASPHTTPPRPLPLQASPARAPANNHAELHGDKQLKSELASSVSKQHVPSQAGPMSATCTRSIAEHQLSPQNVSGQDYKSVSLAKEGKTELHDEVQHGSSHRLQESGPKRSNIEGGLPGPHLEASGVLAGRAAGCQQVWGLQQATFFHGAVSPK